MDWADHDPGRWYGEISALCEVCEVCEVCEDAEDAEDAPDLGGLRTVRATVRVAGRLRSLRIRWPENYPDGPPILEELSESGEPIDHSEDHHVWVDQSLCLFTRGQGERSWRPEDYTVADAVRRFVEFRELADQRAHEPVSWEGDASHAGLPSGFVVRAEPAMLEAMWGKHLCGEAVLRQQLPAKRASFLIEGVMSTSGARLAGNCPDLLTGHGSDSGLGYLAARLQSNILGNVHVHWFVFNNLAKKPWSKLLPDRPSLERLLKGAFPGLAAETSMEPLLLLGRRDKPGELLALPHPFLTGGAHASSFVQVGELRSRIFARVDGAMPARPQLSEATAVMVGLGSVGGSIALSLAKSGVGRFVLFDGERLEPENISRHVADLDWLDAPKVSAVEHLIRARNPDAEVLTEPNGLWWDRVPTGISPSERLREALARPHRVVVVTAANDSLERTVNRIAVQLGAPMVVATVLGDAEHGRVFRVLPGLTPCYACVLRAQRARPERYRWFNGGGQAMPGVGAYRGPGVPGLAIDVEQVTLLGARMTLNTLLRGFGQPDTDEHHMLWTNRGGWGFDRPLQLQIERFERDPACQVCGAKTAPPAPPRSGP